MTKTALLTAAFLLGGTAAALAGNTPPSTKPGISDSYIFPGSENSPAMRQDDATPGYSMDSAMGKAEARAVTRLEDEGYSSITDMTPEVGGFRALAVKDGKVMEVAIDDAGHVTRLR